MPLADCSIRTAAPDCPMPAGIAAKAKVLLVRPIASAAVAQTIVDMINLHCVLSPVGDCGSWLEPLGVM